MVILVHANPLQKPESRGKRKLACELGKNTSSKIPSKGFFLIKEGCPVSPMSMFIKSGELPYEWLEEVAEETALLNPSIAILNGFSREEVKSFFSRAYQKLLVMPAQE